MGRPDPPAALASKCQIQGLLLLSLLLTGLTVPPSAQCQGTLTDYIRADGINSRTGEPLSDGRDGWTLEMRGAESPGPPDLGSYREAAFREWRIDRALPARDRTTASVRRAWDAALWLAPSAGERMWPEK